MCLGFVSISNDFMYFLYRLVRGIFPIVMAAGKRRATATQSPIAPRLGWIGAITVSRSSSITTESSIDKTLIDGRSRMVFHRVPNNLIRKWSL